MQAMDSIFLMMKPYILIEVQTLFDISDDENQEHVVREKLEVHSYM